MKTITSKVYLLEIPLPFRLKEVNLYLLRDYRGCILIDTGPHTEEAITVFGEELQSIGVLWKDIHTVLITHYHSDHCGLAAEIQRRSGADVYMASQDFELLETFWSYPEKVVGPEDFYSFHRMPTQMVIGLKAVIQPLMELIPAFRPDHSYEAGQPVVREPYSFIPIHTPGHTPGHTCLLEQTTGLFFSGDHVLPEITPNIAAHPESPLADPLTTFVESLEKIRCLRASRTLPAHGSPISNLSERVSEIILHHLERKLKIETVLSRGPANAYEITVEIFGNELPLLERWMSFYETLAHLVSLEKERRVELEKSAGTIFYRLPLMPPEAKL